MQHLMRIQANSMQILAKPIQIQANPSESCTNLMQILTNSLANGSKSHANPDNLPKSYRILCESVDKPQILYKSDADPVQILYMQIFGKSKQNLYKSYAKPMQVLAILCKSLHILCNSHANPLQSLGRS